jgi:hypothetical protein
VVNLAGATHSAVFLVWAPKVVPSFVKGYDKLQKSITYIAELIKVKLVMVHMCVCVCFHAIFALW